MNDTVLYGNVGADKLGHTPRSEQKGTAAVRCVGQGGASGRDEVVARIERGRVSRDPLENLYEISRAPAPSSTLNRG